MNRISLLLPLAAFCCGILFSGFPGMLYVGLFLSLAALFIYWFLIRQKVSPVRRMRLNRLHVIWVGMLFTGLGAIDGVSRSPIVPDGSMLGRIRVVDGKVLDKKYSTSGDILTLRVVGLYDSGMCEVDNKGMTLIVYTDNTEADIDDHIIFPASITRISDSSNSFDTGYASMLAAKGIFHAARVTGNDIQITLHEPTLTGYCRHVRDNLVMSVEKTGLGTHAKDFLITVMFGDRAYLDPIQRQLFSNAGVAHVLALSGMHIGIIAGILMWILFPINFLGLYRYRMLLTVILLWGYALITGMAPSTIRACVMTTFVMAAIFLERKNSSLNALCAAALLILIVNPSSIFDVGLQLSFVCVASLIAFAGILNPIDRHLHHRLYNAVGIVIATLIATAASWTLTAYHFHLFPLTFLPANIIMLPLLPWYIILAIVYLMFATFGIEIRLLGTCLDKLHEILSEILRALDTGFSAIHIGVPGWTVVLWLAAMALAFAYVRKYRNRYVGMAAGLLAILSVSIIPFAGTRNYVSDGFIIRDDFRNISLSIRKKGSDSLLNLRRGHVTEISLMGKRIISVDTPSVEYIDKKLSSGKCDFLIVARGYRGNLSDLYRIFRPDKIVIHRSVRRNVEKRWIEEGRSIGLPLHSVRNDRSLKVVFG